MKKTLILFAALMLTSISLWGLFDDYQPSARARGMGNAYYTLSDDASGVFYNPAGTIFAGSQFQAGYSRLYNNDFSILKTVALTMPLPKHFGQIGIGMQAMDVDYQDVNMLSEKTYTLSHGITLMKDIHSELHFGWSANYYYVSEDRFGDQGVVGLNAGAIAVLHTRTRLAFTAININDPKVGKHDDHDLPQRLIAGISYIPYTGVTTSFEMKKTLNGASESDDSPIELHAGAECQLYEVLSLRAGISSQPNTFDAGVGINVKGVKVDYSFSSHSVLDGTHYFSLGYTL